jgi:CRP-like cAMP-binding protein
MPKPPGISAQSPPLPAVNHINGLLSALPPEFEPEHYGAMAVTLPWAQVLMEPGDMSACVYFPTTSVLSVVASMASGEAAEVVSIGREGMTGIPEVWMESPASTRVRVEIAGEAYVMTAEGFRDLLREYRGFQQSTLAFGTGLLGRMTQSPVCYRYHSVKQQCARWLLTNQARLGTDYVPVTHDHLAELLGVFRPTVTFALRELRDLDLVEVRRGRVHILDR